MTEKADLAYEKAARYFNSGFNCAQAVIKAVYEAGDEDAPAGLLNAAAGMSGGIGFSGCVCGALNGGVMLLGYRLGGDKKSAAKARGLSSKLARWFNKRFGTTCCILIRDKRPFADKEAKRRCTEATAETAREIVKMLG
jgi:C_GCAxxG_C_C family probable redox protein